MTCSAVDTVGNESSRSFVVHVRYGFAGFFAPIDTVVMNKVKAGRAVPTKFSLGGDMGLGILALDSPSSQPASCDTATESDPVETRVSAGESSLSYDATSDRYDYVWKTDASWARTCRTLNVTLNDGSVHSALFHFVK